jgi:gamma-glutamyltranspeptidase / glutathione hydrolase / leukotriene-C4 hydrolase
VTATTNDQSTFHTFPLPSNGAIIVFMLNLLKDYDLKHDALSYHRIVEAFKFAYGRRTFLGDEPSEEIREIMRNLTNVDYAYEIRKLISDEKTSEDFKFYGAKFENKEDHGTAHISILMPNGDAVS